MNTLVLLAALTIPAADCDNCPNIDICVTPRCELPVPLLSMPTLKVKVEAEVKQRARVKVKVRTAPTQPRYRRLRRNLPWKLLRTCRR